MHVPNKHPSSLATSSRSRLLSHFQSPNAPCSKKKFKKKTKTVEEAAVVILSFQRRESIAACIFFTSIFHVRYGNTISTLEYADCITLNGLWNEVLAPFFIPEN